MRKFLIPLLLATTVATPAFARPPKDEDDDRVVKVERSAPRAARSEERSERPRVRQQVERRSERPNVQQRIEQRDDREAPRGAFAQRRSGVDPREVEIDRREIEELRSSNVNERGRPTLATRERRSDSVSNWRERERSESVQRRGDRDGTGQWTGTRHRAAPVGARPDRPAPLPQAAQHRERRPEWRSSWRNDHRYDWRNHRRHHRSLFRLGVYFDPFGWNYRRYNVGWRLWPSYYSSNYWLNDPFMYRLPYAPWPYKWVRYYDDALLVDTTTGQVVDVMYDFFW